MFSRVRRTGPKKPSFFRSIVDLISFFQLPAEHRQVVFYSEGKTYWVHLEGILRAFLDITDNTVCYITSDCNDPGLQLQHPKLRHFRTDEAGIRNWLFENIDTRVMVMTMPDLHQYQVKRSKHKVHYVYLQHSLVSFHMVYRGGAFDYFDSIFCAGPHHIRETRALEAYYQLPRKNLVEHGYGRLDSIIENRKSKVSTRDELPAEKQQTKILIAPSWGDDSISNTVIDDILVGLLGAGYAVIFRPHPQTVKFCAGLIEALDRKFSVDSAFTLEVDVSGEESLHQSDLMISDWSGAALDYAFGLEKPVLFVDVPRKINNPNYSDISIEPFEVGIRERIGAVLPLDEMAVLPAVVKKLLQRASSDRIDEIRTENVFNVETSAQAGANALKLIVEAND
ncbi:MAG: CDP-glycerol--glycerophosphate glycerophosphotransferase [Gammaproteobacteria bacterium]|nr:MAG: CDP-glycerol--glycerophosphate glycerophosphotransferase [Gammaproteobacteria bacterium]